MRAFRLFILLLCVAAVVAFSQTGSNPSAPPSGARPADANAGKTTDQAYKNIQVVKGLPADELIPAMQYFNAALGVECGYCHVVQPTRAFEKDDKDEKKTARQMITMTQGINKDNFKGDLEVGCATCHAGRTNPTSVPPVGDEHQGGPRQAAAQAQASQQAQPATPGQPAGEAKPQLPTVQQVEDNYETAIGGRAAIQKLTSEVATGTATTAQGTIQVELDRKAPNFLSNTLTFPNGRTTVDATNGTVGWNKAERVNDYNGYTLRTILMTSRFDRDLAPTTAFTNSRVTGTDTINGHDCYVVRGTLKDPAYSERLWFDKQTGLLVRRITYQKTLFGPLADTADYSDYRDVQGVKVPFTVMRSRPGQTFTVKYDKITFNAPVDDSKFIHPPAAGQ